MKVETFRIEYLTRGPKVEKLSLQPISRGAVFRAAATRQRPGFTFGVAGGAFGAPRSKKFRVSGLRGLGGFWGGYDFFASYHCEDNYI